MLSLSVVFILCLFSEFGYTVFFGLEGEEDRCDAIMKEIVSKDRETVADNAPTKLHSTWLSQGCEIRAGPEYIIRKYSFFENNTFHLLRYHYAEESCSIATYTLVARGSIKISSPSVTVPGASEANVQVDSVHLILLDREIAHKFGRRINASCGGIEAKLRLYKAQLIYERPINTSLNTSFQVHGLNSNSFKSRLPRQPRKPSTLECLDSLGIEFTELSLLRVEKRGSDFATNSSNRYPIGATNHLRTRVELLLGELARNGRFQKLGTQKPNRLQSAALIRADTATHCSVCKDVLHSTEYRPPLFHQVPLLPAVIGGHWLSIRCESIDGGSWRRRFFRIDSSVNKWSASWTYYADPTCSNFLYTVITAGTYVQQAIRQKRDETSSLWRIDDSEGGTPNGGFNAAVNDVRIHFKKAKRNVISNIYPRIVQNIIRKKPITQSNVKNTIALSSARKDAALPSGTTELVLHVIHSHCAVVTFLPYWPRICVSQTVRASETLRFKARISLDSNGDYTLLLGSWNNDLWEAPLRRCSETTLPNYFQAQNGSNDSPRERVSPLQYKPPNRRGRYWFSSSSASCLSFNCPFIVLILFLSCWSHFVYCQIVERDEL